MNNKINIDEIDLFFDKYNYKISHEEYCDNDIDEELLVTITPKKSKYISFDKVVDNLKKVYEEPDNIILLQQEKDNSYKLLFVLWLLQNYLNFMLIGVVLVKYLKQHYLNMILNTLV